MKNYPVRSYGALPRIAAFGLVLSLSPGLPAAFAQASGAGNKEEEPQKLEAFSITGSRIRRIDSETPQPVVRITESDFKATGFTTLGDAIRAMPAIAGQSLVSTDGGTSFTPGVSSFNLRGLGNNNTLVLINGRRAAPYASAGFNGFQTVFDFNSIPTAAIESLEVLKDGASAIYGSDAVAGVINVNLKKNYTGFTSELSFGNTSGTDSAEKSAFFIFGTKAGKVSLITTFDYQQRASIDGADLAWSDESDGTPYGGLDQRSTSGPIAAVRGLTGLAQFPNGRAGFTTPQTAPTLANAANITPLYNFQENVGFTPDTRSFGFYTRAVYEFNDYITGFLDASFRRSEVDISAAPTPYVTSQELGDSPAGAGIFPASNPFNPFGQNILDLRWRISELGRRIQDITADSPRLVAGLEGRLPDSEWSWSGALLYSKNTIEQLARNATSDRLVQNAFNGVRLNGVVKYANPFGPNDPDIINYLRIINPNHDEFEVRSADISATGPIFKLPAGDLNMAIGAEVRTERMENIGTQLNRDSQIVGGSAGSDTYGDRRLYSYYAELSIPVFKHNDMSLELQAAARHEQYSDFGNTTKPKLAAVFRPIPEVLIRGSYGESFLAPNLAYLYTTVSTSFTANTLADPLRPQDPRVQIRQFGGGNPGLQPEETKVVYGGIVLQPFIRNKDSIFRELSFGVDYFKFDQENLISRLTASQILTNPAFTHLVVRNAPTPGDTIGTISGVLTTWQNLSVGKYEGYDFNVRWVLPRRSYGQIRAELSGTYIDSQEFTTATGALVDVDGEYSSPQFRGTATFAWNKGDWAASLFVTHIGHYMDAFQIARIKSQTIYSPQVAYKGWFNSTITVGVRNILNQDPPIDLSDSKLVNENTNWVEPAFWYVRWSKDW
ncbi:MAG: TonB-dependent receptor [Opitutae bacterium]|nr:TonB-dependent receptor [Opitutae bacterium]